MRSPGEGSLYYRKSTGRWYAELIVGHDADGKRETWRFSSKLKREAVAALEKAKADRLAAQPTPADQRTVADYLAEWLETVRTTREPRTWIGYRSLVDNHILPSLGPYRLRDLRPQRIQALLTDLSERLSPTTVLHVHRCLHRALETALRHELIDRNPSHLVTPPRAPRREQTTLTTAQSRTLLQAAQSDPLRCYWTLALTTAMRTSELSGLRWTDVDYDARALRVSRSLQYVAGAWREAETKTHRARRVVLTEIGLAALREHRARQAEARLAAGPQWQDRGLVFTEPDGSPQTPWRRRRSWARLLGSAGLPIVRMYDLRHTAASLLASWGIPVAVIAELLGHSSTKMTHDVYISVMPTMQAEAMRLMDERLAPSGSVDS